MSNKDVPILFIFFNRPEMALRVIGEIRKWRPRNLIIASDGPRRSKDGEDVVVRDLRRAIENSIDWPVALTKLYSDINEGCARKVSSSITQALSLHESVIILEDDCLPSEQFFDFIAFHLLKHRHDESVYSVSGSRVGCFGRKGQLIAEEVGIPLIWGWGTWARAWRKYSLCVGSDVPHRLQDRKAKTYRAYSSSPWIRLYEKLLEVPLFTWDYQFILLTILNSKKAICPNYNLVKNIGYGADATHTTSEVGRFVIELPVDRLEEYYIKQENLPFNESYSAFLQNEYFDDSNSLPAILFKIKYKLFKLTRRFRAK